MSRRFRPQDEAETQHREELPLDKPVALYYRQSTEAQIGNISTTIQTVDMFDRLVRMGWREDQIILIDSDAGVSGRLAIDQREGMSELFGLIVNKQIGAVAAQDEDRLFRDETMIQVNIFITACREAGVKVITPNVVYDFSHPQWGVFHARQFRFKCELGAEYINTQIIERMVRARQYLMKTGRWAGTRIPIGYMVDMRKEIAPNERNPNYRLIFPFEPYAEVVREYYRIFINCGGSVAQAQHEIVNNRVFFPKIKSAPHGFKVGNYIKPKAGGIFLSRGGLKRLLMNPTYIGHWVYRDMVVRWNNHEPIVPEELFWEAFHYLSPYLPDGSDNTQYRPVKQNARPSIEARRGVEKPLCTGLLFGKENGQEFPITTQWESRQATYVYDFAPMDYNLSTATSKWRRRADRVDDAIVYHLMRRLEYTFSEEGWQEMLQQLNQPQEDDSKRKKRRLQEVQTEMTTILNKLEMISEPDWIEHEQRRYQSLKDEKARLMAELESKRTEAITLEKLKYLKEHFGHLVEKGWERMEPAERRIFIREMIRKIMLKEANTRLSRLMVEWADGGQTEVVLYRTAKRENLFTYAEIEEIRAMLEKGATREQLYEALPHHNKRSIDSWRRRMIKTFGIGTKTSIKCHVYPFKLEFLLKVM